MDEYIEREKVLELAYWHGKHLNFDNLNPDGVDAVDVTDVERISAADVSPVVHARWVDGKCSNCGVDIPTDDLHDVIFGSECHYCYFCGAKMDGGVDDAVD